MEVRNQATFGLSMVAIPAHPPRFHWASLPALLHCLHQSSLGACTNLVGGAIGPSMAIDAGVDASALLLTDATDFTDFDRLHDFLHPRVLVLLTVWDCVQPRLPVSFPSSLGPGIGPGKSGSTSMLTSFSFTTGNAFPFPFSNCSLQSPPI